MNKERRKEFWDVYTSLDEAMSKVIEIRSDEEDSFDNLPDGLQASKTGESIHAAIDWLNETELVIQSVRDRIERYIKTKNYEI